MISSIKSELLKYGETTSIRGVPKFFKSKDVFLKLLWLVCVLACTAVLIFLLITLFQKFYLWPVMTKYGEKIGEDIKFPDVTICNLDPFSVGFPTELPISLYFDFLVKHEAEIINKSVEAFNHTLSKLNLENLYEELYSVSGYIFNLPKSRSENADCPDFIVDCTLFTTDWFPDETECSITNFTKRWNENHYTCYTLQTSKLNFVNKNTVTRGLTLLLNVGPPNTKRMPYRSSLINSQARGVQISVHSPGTPPDLKRGFSVAPGTENIVTIVQTERERLNHPHNKLGCTKDTSMPNSPTEGYTHDLCIEYCKQEVIYREYDCTSHFLSVPSMIPADVEICGNFSKSRSDPNIDDLDSMALTFKTFINAIQSFFFDEPSSCELSCLIPCKETLYDTYLTSASWPQPSFQLAIFDTYVRERNCVETHPSVKKRYAAYLDYINYTANSDDSDSEIPYNSLTQIQESFLEVKFVIKQNFPYYLSDNPAYTWDTMIGVVGGMLSLWLGITAATGVELIELVYLLFKSCCCNKKTQRSETNLKKNNRHTNPNVDNSDSVMTTVS